MKTVIVTGSEGLIGSEICKYFEKNNVKVLRIDLKLGHNLTNEEFVKKWFKKNTAEYLVNCFALNDHVHKDRKKRTVFDFSLEDFSDYLSINLVSLFSVCREFARNNKKGSIVNFSSTYGIVSPRTDIYEGSHKDIAYGVSKAGVINLTKYLAIHFAPYMRVNCVIPGGVFANQNKKFIKNYSNLTPMKRMMKKTELNEIIDYLCSEKSSYITGSSFVVDGGYTSW
ncbi:MAG: SDR family oxidoreductase [Thaumarchaeota archaeon]|nr:SDR family oxidoreductase [Nitrososphaerota archaeon]